MRVLARGSLGRYVAVRLAATLLLLLALSFIVFGLLHLTPGDPALSYPTVHVALSGAREQAGAGCWGEAVRWRLGEGERRAVAFGGGSGERWRWREQSQGSCCAGRTLAPPATTTQTTTQHGLKTTETQKFYIEFAIPGFVAFAAQFARRGASVAERALDW